MRMFNKMKGLSLFLAFQIMFFSSVSVTYAGSVKPLINVKPSGLKVGLKPGSAIVLNRGEITKKNVVIEEHDFVFDGRATIQDVLDEIKDPDAKACTEALVDGSVLGSLKDNVIDGLVIIDSESLKPSSLKCGKVLATLVPTSLGIGNSLSGQGPVQTGDGWMANMSHLFVNEAHAAIPLLLVEAAAVGVIIGGTVVIAAVAGLMHGDIISDLAMEAVDAYCKNQPDKCSSSEDGSDDGGEGELEEEEEEEITVE